MRLALELSTRQCTSLQPAFNLGYWRRYILATERPLTAELAIAPHFCIYLQGATSLSGVLPCQLISIGILGLKTVALESSRSLDSVLTPLNRDAVSLSSTLSDTSESSQSITASQKNHRIPGYIYCSAPPPPLTNFQYSNPFCPLSDSPDNSSLFTLF